MKMSMGGKLAAPLLLAALMAGCGDDSDGNISDQLEAAADGSQEAPQQDEAQAPEVEEQAAPVEIETVTVDEAVHFAGMEYAVSEMTVNDLDAENSPDGQVGERLQGVELVFEVDVHNNLNDNLTPNAPVAAQWDEPGTENMVEAGGMTEIRSVPADSSASGEIVIQLLPEDLELFDAESLRLMFGQPGQAQAQMPIGGEPELIDRFPIPQADMKGQSFDFVHESGNLSVNVLAADIRWNMGNTQIDDGLALLELTVELQNDTSGQRCWSRGAGNNFTIEREDGQGYVDERMDGRGCTASGATTVSQTGIFLDEDFAGDYTLEHQRRFDFDDMQDELEITLVDEGAVRDSERTDEEDFEIDDDDDDDDDDGDSDDE